jgi:hypothetical protein
LGDYRVQINPFWEILKSLVGRQDKHTLPALGLALTELVPKPKAKYFVQMGLELRREIQAILGKFELEES